MINCEQIYIDPCTFPFRNYDIFDDSSFELHWFLILIYRLNIDIFDLRSIWIIEGNVERTQKSLFLVSNNVIKSCQNNLYRTLVTKELVFYSFHCTLQLFFRLE